MRKSTKKLRLHRETLRLLDAGTADLVAAGCVTDPCIETNTCHWTCCPITEFPRSICAGQPCTGGGAC